MPGWKGKGSDRCFSHDLQFKVQMAEERWPKCIKRGYIERVAGEEYCSNSPFVSATRMQVLMFAMLLLSSNSSNAFELPFIKLQTNKTNQKS